MTDSPMKAERSAMVRFDLRDYDNKPHPRTFWLAIAPTATRAEWVPQTMGEQIWGLYEFADTAVRNAFMESLAPDLKPNATARDQAFFDQWTG